MRRPNWLPLAAALVSAWTAVACGTSAPGVAAPAQESCSEANATPIAIVQLHDWGFTPSCFKVAVGADVTLLNAGKNPDRVITDAGQAESFDSGIIPAGDAVRHPFTTAGPLSLRSAYYAQAHATVIVLP